MSSYDQSNEFSHQFKHSDYERRNSVVYGSLGKGGLFIPKDFVTPRAIDSFVDENSVESDEQSPLIVAGPNHRRKSTIERDILRKEREVLKDNNIFVSSDTAAEDEDEEHIRRTFEEAVVANKIPVTTVSLELRHLLKSSIPLVLTFLLQNSLSTVSVLSVGHLGATELAAVSMGSMTANITGYAAIQGVATALDTLCPQAFGAKKYHLVGAYFQKCTALIFTFMLPILVVWLFFGYQLICLMVPDKETAKLSAVYLQYITPGIPGYILFECGKRFLQAQGVYHISTYVLFIAAPSNAIMNFYFVSKLGYYGAPLAVAINYWIMALGLLVGTVYFVKPEQTASGLHPLKCWNGLNVKEAFGAWDKLIYLAIPGLIMLEAEFLAFEILTLIASYLGTVALAAQSVGSTMASLTYQIPFAIGIAASTRIANYLGAGLAESAKKSTQVALSFGLVISAFNFIVLFTFDRQIANMFTSDERVIKAIEGVMWLIALMQVSDAVNANSAGCLRGQGQTKIGGIVNLVSYYIVGLPLSIYLTFYSPWKGTLDGLWIGSTVALTLIGVIQSYYALFADFNKLCEDARNRTGGDSTV
ncbi:ethionine resistance protein [Yamadazyma tenuis]|uniref:Ethionine resistance protein n=1 Tax=Candida tenuis (strain ATCC 10573 / BCRC 21748 / CBS 615 / JCM 9827 / NBRC 10315 / NRRL Y-1498 / VKM Y-70) TaxID=590646 RepID=G3B2Z4_CANTC|nr:ethionine resistance protein [Yamadazyma tenuis ATCC 10573]EGV64041.1 ethionine resistance protein [Yamadazyma tenuis ATCC 10573]WEJ96332.1 ethionine resistance protein [Yamadazyma tenuis]